MNFKEENVHNGVLKRTFYLKRTFKMIKKNVTSKIPLKKKQNYYYLSTPKFVSIVWRPTLGFVQN